MRHTILLLIFQLVAFSALTTDRLQTQHWIEGTPQEPVRSPNGFLIYEINPVLAGRPEMLDPYFDTWSLIVEAIPQTLSPSWAMLTLGAIAFDEVKTVISNNRVSAVAGFPQYWGLSYRWRF